MGNYAKILKEICQELQIALTSFSDDWAFRLEKDSKVRYIYGYRFGLDCGSIQQFCTDKAIMSDLLEFYQIPHIRHFFFMNEEDYEKSGETLLERYRKVVCKANEGTGGNRVFMAENKAQMDKAAKEIFDKGSSLAISPYVEIEKEYRAIVLDSEIKLLYSKERPYVIGDGIHTVAELVSDDNRKILDFELANKIPKNDEMVLLNWRHNLGQGANPVMEISQDAEMAVKRIVERVLKKTGIRFASVDVAEFDGNYAVLELNSGVMMEYFSKVSEENYQIAKNIYKEAVWKLFD